MAVRQQVMLKDLDFLYLAGGDMSLPGRWRARTNPDGRGRPKTDYSRERPYVNVNVIPKLNMSLVS